MINLHFENKMEKKKKKKKKMENNTEQKWNG